MNRNIWRYWAAALIALLALVGVAGAVQAALPQATGQAAPPAANSDAGTKPEVVDCSQITAKHIDQQMNLHAAAILAACGKAGPAIPQEKATIGGSAAGKVSPNNYGGVDVNVILPEGTSPHITQSETFVWGHGSTIVVNYNDSRSAPSCYSGISYSTDSGATFTRSSALCAGHGTNFGDPAVVWDNAHSLWVAMDLASGCGGQGVGAWNSPDGITWTARGCAMSSSQGDRNSAWVDDTPSSPYYGTVYASYNDFNIGGGALFVSRSTDAGVTWSAGVTLNPAFIRDVQLTGAADGTVLEAAMNENGGGLANRNNVFYRSTNGGATWTNSYTGPAFYPPGRSVSGYFAGMYASGYFRHMGWGQPAGGGPQLGGQNVFHYVYAMGIQGSDPGNIMYIRSTDSGSTWSTPLQLNTDSTTKAQFMPALSETAGGALLATWFDERNNGFTPPTTCTAGATAPCYEWYGRVSLDGGVTWQPDAPVSDLISPLPAQPDPNIQPLYAGDYNYASADGTNAYTTWVDGRNLINGAAQQDVYFDKVPLIQGTPTPTPTGTLPTATRTSTPTLTPTATPTVCGGSANYSITSGTGAVVPATTFVPGTNADDFVAPVALPFAFRLYDQTYNSVNVSTNGNAQFVSTNTAFSNECLPSTTIATYSIFPYWDDLLLTSGGIYTLVEGSAPNRIFDIEWRGGYYPGPTGTVDFELRLYENSSTGRFDVIYGAATNGNTSATIGVQRDSTVFTQYACNGSGGPVTAGLQLSFNQPSCGTATSTPTGGPSNTPTRTVTPGGATATATATAACTPSAGGWSAGPQLPTPLVRAVGVYFPADGKFYTVGGRTSDAAGSDFQHVLQYTPGNPGTWVQKGVTLPDNTMNNMACGVLTVGGTPQIYCVGGSAAGQTTATARVFAYNPATDTATVLASGDNWPGAGTSVLPGGFVVVANKLYILGGFNINVASTNQIYQFDPTAAVGAKWTLKNAVTPAGIMYASTAAYSGLIYVLGASDYQGGTVVDTTTTFAYNPTTDTIINTVATVPRANGETRALTVGNQIWVMGGGRVAPNPSNEVDAYTPSSNSWSLPPAFQNPRRNFPTDTDGSTVWLAGGYEPSAAAQDMEIYRPGTVCNTPTPAPATSTATATSAAPTSTRTATAVPPSSTSVPATNTSVPATNTSVPATNTRVPATNTSVPATNTSVPATNTGVPATNTNVPASNTPGPATATSTPCTITFTDVNPTDYFYVPVQYLYCHGVISGYADNTFRPYANTTRSQMVKIVVLGFNKPIQTPANGGYTFTDVPPANPFFGYIETAAALNIVSGYNCGGPGEPCDAQNRPYFRPYANVTRGQLSKIDVVAAGWGLLNPPSQTFADVLPNTAFYPFVETAACHGVVSGYTCGGPGEPCDSQNRPYFRQNNDATRGQIAKIVYLSITNQSPCNVATVTTK